MPISLLSSSPQYSEGSQIIPTVNGLINQINSQALFSSTAQPTFRNAIVGGNFGTNLWQRGTSFTAIANTLTYTADRFFAIGGASSSISVSRQTGTTLPGFTTFLRFGRADANADTTAIKLGQVLTSGSSIRFQGKPFVVSLWVRAASGFSAASSALSFTVATGTGTDETAVNYAAGSWTGYAAATLYNSTGSAGSTATLTTAWQRVAFSGVIPVTATQIGFNIAYTPVGTASSDYIEIAGVQLEVMPQGGVTPSPFEYRPPAIEAELQYYFYFRATEGQIGAKMFQGQVNSTTVASILVPFPVAMRTVNTTSVTATTTSIGSFTLTAAGGAATNSLASSGGLAWAAHSFTNRSGVVTATLSQAALTAAGDTTFLIAGNGGGYVAVSSEL